MIAERQRFPLRKADLSGPQCLLALLAQVVEHQPPPDRGGRQACFGGESSRVLPLRSSAATPVSRNPPKPACALPVVALWMIAIALRGPVDVFDCDENRPTLARSLDEFPDDVALAIVSFCIAHRLK